MKSNWRRRAALYLIYAALVVAHAARAANPKYTPLAPKNPSAQAAIAARNAAGQQLLGSQRGDWRRNMDFLKALAASSNPASKIPSLENSPFPQRPISSNATGSSATQFLSPAPAHVASETPRATASTTSSGPSANFGGFLVAPSYQAIQYPPAHKEGGDWILNTLSVDLNKDGYPDLITVDVSGDLNVMLNDGKGGFLPPITNTGAATIMANTNFLAPLVYLTAGDVNGDGLPDIIATRWGGTTSPDFPSQPAGLYVFLNQGGGKFSNPTVVTPALANGEQLSAILVTDRDGDGKADIVAVSFQELITTDANGNTTGTNSNINMQTLFSNGDGTFKNYGYITHYSLPGYAVIVPNGGAQFTTLGGSKYLAVECEVFSGSSLFSVGTSALFFKDLNGGRASAPVADVPSQQVDFGSNYFFALSFVNGLSLADINGDGNPDITLSFGDMYLYGALGKSDGTFGPAQLIESGTFAFNPSGWAIADVNGDGNPDLIDLETFYQAIWLGAGDGTFADPKVFYTSNENNSLYPGSYPGNNLVAADFDRDGLLDFATSDSTGGIWYGRTSIFRGYGDGTFAGAPSFAPPDGNPQPDAFGATQVLDLNGDGLSDTVAVNSANGSLVSAISDGKGNFTFNAHALPSGVNGFFIAGIAGSGDFNGDGRQDLLLTGYQVGSTYKERFVYSFAVALSNGDGTFASPVVVPSSVQLLFRPFGAQIADVNKDGKLDIVLSYDGDPEPGGMGRKPAQHNPPGILAALGNGDGTFQQATYTPASEAGYSFAVNDLNGDGYPDMLVWDARKSQIFMLPGSASGFQPQNESLVVDLSDWYVDDIHTADVNNDGNVDFLIAVSGKKNDGNSFVNAGIQTYLNDGKGGFTLASTAQQGLPPAGVFTVADFNGDGCADMVVELSIPSSATTTTYSAHTLLGNCDGTFQAPQQEMLIPAWPIFTTGNFTADGVTSIEVASGKSANYVLFNQGGTTLKLTSSQSSITQGASISFTAEVEPTWAHRPIPGGTITFYNNGVLLGTQPVSGGAASFSTSNLAAGSHAITVAYSGDENFNPHQNATQVNVTVTTPVPVQPEFSITAPPQNLYLSPGETKTVPLTVQGSATYNGSVQFSVIGALGGLNVTVNPTSVSLAGGNPAQVSITVSTLKKGNTAMAHPGSGPLGIPAGAVALGLCLFGSRRIRRRSWWICTLMLAAAVGLCTVSTGCSSSNYAQRGASTIVVTATPSVAGASPQTTTFLVVVE